MVRRCLFLDPGCSFSFPEVVRIACLIECEVSSLKNGQVIGWAGWRGGRGAIHQIWDRMAN